MHKQCLLIVLVTSILFVPLQNSYSDSELDSKQSDDITHNDIISHDTQKLSDIDKQKLTSLAIPFVQNVGQSDDNVKYYAKMFSGTIFVTDDGLTYSFTDGDKKGFAIKERFISGVTVPSGKDDSATTVNFFIGHKENWKSNVPAFDTVSLGYVWPRIDVSLHAHGNNVEKIFTINPDGDVKNIKMTFDGTNSLSSEDGKLLLKTDLGAISMTKPVAYQEINGVQHYVQVSYAIDGNSYGFDLGDYNKSYPLVIDPLLASTYVGGSSFSDFASGIFYDPQFGGSVYIVGSAVSSDFPVTLGAYQTTHNSGGNFGRDVFVSKFSPDLSTLKASTFLGGSADDEGNAITIDTTLALHSITIVGTTSSQDFPTTQDVIQPSYGGAVNDAFVAVLDPDLTTLQASTFIGGTGNEEASAVTVNTNTHDIYVTGTTDFGFQTTQGAYETCGQGNGDAFVVKLRLDLAELKASTCVGGFFVDDSKAIALDPTGTSVYIGGYAENLFPVTNGAYQTTNHGGFGDAFVSKLDADLTTLEASTFIGGTQDERVNAITISQNNVVYVAGYTYSTDFNVTSGAYQTIHGDDHGLTDAFVSKFSSDLTTLEASTYLGGDNSDVANVILVDSLGNVYVAGGVASFNFPTTIDAYQKFRGYSFQDVFVSKFSSDLTTLEASTYLGGDGPDEAYAMTFGPGDNLYLTGQANHEFPVTQNAYQKSSTSASFVSEIDNNLAFGDNCGKTIDLFDKIVEGTNLDDVLVGSSGNDLILGRNGDDRIFGQAGDDCIIEGDGTDYITGGSGSDTITIMGSGNNKIWGGSGDDIINGGNGNDKISGNSGNDILNGNGGNDFIWGQAGDDTINGGGGTDTCIDFLGTNTVTGCETYYH